MPIIITQETKTNITITPESKPGGSDTFAMHPETFADNSGTFGAPRLGVVPETKNSLTITPESKT